MDIRARFLARVVCLFSGQVSVPVRVCEQEKRYLDVREYCLAHETTETLVGERHKRKKMIREGTRSALCIESDGAQISFLRTTASVHLGYNMMGDRDNQHAVLSLARFTSRFSSGTRRASSHKSRKQD